MKIKLITPPFSGRLLGYVPYGMATVFGMIKSSHIVSQVDLNILCRDHKIDLRWLDLPGAYELILNDKHPIVESQCRKIIRLMDISDDVLFFSVHSYHQMILGLALAKMMKRDLGSKIVFGGSYFPNSDIAYIFKNFRFIDIISVGHFEGNSSRIFKAIGTGRRQIFFNHKPMRNYVIPDYSGLDLDAYRTVDFNRDVLILPILTSSGCTFRCNFCSHRNNEKVKRFKNKEIISNIICMRRYTDHFHFANISLGSDKKDIQNLCSAIISSGLDIRWESKARADCLDEETIDLMAKSGCRSLEFGFESGSPGVLRDMNKQQDLKYFSKIIRYAHRKGIRVLLTLVVGYPTETEEDFKKTLLLLKKERDYIDIIIDYAFSVGRGSEIFDKPGKYGVIISDHQDLLNIISTKSKFDYVNHIDVSKRKDMIRRWRYQHLQRRKYPLLYMIPFWVFRKVYMKNYYLYGPIGKVIRLLHKKFGINVPGRNSVSY